MLKTEQLADYKTLLIEVLAEEGYRPRRNDHDDIELKFEGKQLYFDFDSNDPAYVRLLLPYFWKLDSPSEQRLALVAAGHASERCKGVKVFVESEDSVWASVEFLVPRLERPEADVINRQICMIRAGTDEFVRKMNELQAAHRPAREVVTH